MAKILFVILSFFAPLTYAAYAKKTLRLITIEAPPFMSASLPEQGAATFALRECFKKMGYDLEVTFAPLLRARIMSLQRNDVAGFFPTSAYTLSNNFTMSKVIYSSPWGFAERKTHSIKWNSPADLSSLKIGNVTGYDLTPTLQALHQKKPFNIESVSSDELNLLKLARKRIDIAFVDAGMFEYLLRTSPQLQAYKDDLQMNPKILQVDDYGLAFKKGTLQQEQMESFNKTFNKDEFLTNIKNYYAKHLSSPVTP